MVDLRGPQQPAYGTDDTQRYTHPPPAYGGDSSPLLGTPRTSEDNVGLLLGHYSSFRSKLTSNSTGPG